jgi:uncharacterized protein (DUF779 family)
MYIYQNTVAHLCNACCNGNATMCFVYTAVLHNAESYKFVRDLDGPT